MNEKYSYTKQTKEFNEFKGYLNRVLTRRGKRRTEYITELENYFCEVWTEAQTLHLEQYRELMKDKRELRNQVRIMQEQHDSELSELERQNDKLREQLLVRKS